MATRTGFDASMDAVEMDLLCTFAGVPAPFPLRVPSAGATEAHRRRLFGAARERLAARGLADPRGPLGIAEIFVHLLTSCPTALDLMLAIGSDRRLGAVLLGYRGEAVLAISEMDAPDPFVGLVALEPDDAVDELLRLIPDLDAARATPFTLPRPALATVYRVLLAQREPLGRHELDELLSAHGIDERQAGRLVTQLLPVLGNGQAGLLQRGGYAADWRRVGTELRWLDTGRGRVKLGGSAEWTSVNPLFPNELYAALRQLAASVGRN